jgi:Na+/H+-dicarboxylate symporter
MNDTTPPRGFFARWHNTPLYIRIIGALILGCITGVMLGERAVDLAIPAKLVLRLLGALAPALILVAVIHALMTADIKGRTTGKMAALLVMNTLVAIFIGLLVANVIQPGRGANLAPDKRDIFKVADIKDAPAFVAQLRDASKPLSQEVWKRFSAEGRAKLLATPDDKETLVAELNRAITGESLYKEELFRGADLRDETHDLLEEKPQGEKVVLLNRYLLADAYPGMLVRKASAGGRPDMLTQFLDNVPKSLLGPLTDDGKVLGVIFLALALGLALRRDKDTQIRTLEDAVEIALRAFITILHWVIDIIPLAIFGIVASIVGKQGFSAFESLGKFVLAVIVALLLQAIYYLTRIYFGSWVRPLNLLRGTRDALVMAFSTASSTATMPVTYERLKNNVGLRERSASLGSLVGANFNNDGTALYEAMSALFIAQMLGMELSLTQQFLVVITSVIASVGAAGIPEAGLVTMTLVFTAVGLPVEYIAILLTVDWFLDRCRTTINVMGDMNVSCLLDGKVRKVPGEMIEATA